MSRDIRNKAALKTFHDPQQLTKQYGKHRHVTKNTLTRGRLKTGNRTASRALIKLPDEKPSYPTKKNRGFFAKWFGKLFGKKGGI